MVTFNARCFLRRGDEVTSDYQSIAAYGSRINTRNVQGIELIDHVVTLGKRHCIAGIERSLYGMQPGGYREILVSSHLAYREVGVPNLIPADALLRIQLWVQKVQNAT
ncbi:MAG: FKBP-type peptidyl-prolyl cis-trans isomerase [Candidatus Competibacteraceae bacterium]|nr:FKBP-type peptidyl-prolyl cis-trans isomerase [Candidatus Competibacteraceae bacterium]